MYVNKYLLVIAIVFIMADKLFWLVPTSMINTAGEIACVAAGVMFFSSQARKLRIIANQNYYHFGKEMIFPIIMMLYSALVSYLNFGQTFVQGMLPQRFFVIGCLFYFVVVNLFLRNHDYLEKIEQFVFLLGCVEILIYLPQYFLSNVVIYLNCPMSIRLGSVRMSTSTCALPFTIFYCLNAIFQKKKHTIVYWMFLLAGLYYGIVVSKTRIAMVAYLCAILLAYLLWKKGGNRKLFFLVPLAIAVAEILSSELFSYLITGLKQGDLSSQIRVVGREYYISCFLQNFQSFLFGNGYINTNCSAALAFSRATDGILWVDLGVYAVAFFFGIVGIGWLVTYIAKFVLCAWKLKNCNNLLYMAYIIYLIVLMPNAVGFLWNFNAMLTLATITACLEYRLKESSSTH